MHATDVCGLNTTGPRTWAKDAVGAAGTHCGRANQQEVAPDRRDCAGGLGRDGGLLEGPASKGGRAAAGAQSGDHRGDTALFQGEDDQVLVEKSPPRSADRAPGRRSVATGIAWRRLGVAALEALVGAGVFYGAAGSEARAMRGQDVFVVGAGNSAGQAAIHLARYAASVTILARGPALG